MLIMSLLVALLGPLSEIFYLRDYWHPQLASYLSLSTQDLLFGFSIGGISAAIYEEIFRKKDVVRHLPNRQKVMLVTSIAVVVAMYLGNIYLGINSIYASVAGMLVIGIVTLIFRHDLVLDAFFSGLLVGLLMLFFYITFTHLFNGIIQKWWMLNNTSGILIFGAPLEEIVWGFSWGFAAGPIYEYLNGLSIKNIE